MTVGRTLPFLAQLVMAQFWKMVIQTQFNSYFLPLIQTLSIELIGTCEKSGELLLVGHDKTANI